MRKIIKRAAKKVQHTTTRLISKKVKERNKKRLKAIQAASNARLAMVSHAAARAHKLGYRLDIITIERKGLPVFKCKLVKLSLVE